MEKLELFKNLDKILEDEAKVYRLLLDCVRKEKELLIESKVSELEENNKQKEILITKIKSLEKERELAALELARATGANTQQPRLLDIATKVEPAQAAKLKATHQTFELLMTQIQEVNDSNALLVDNALRTLDGALGIIRDSVQTNQQTYGQSGEVKKTDKASGHFVSKQV